MARRGRAIDIRPALGRDQAGLVARAARGARQGKPPAEPRLQRSRVSCSAGHQRVALARLEDGWLPCLRSSLGAARSRRPAPARTAAVRHWRAPAECRAPTTAEACGGIWSPAFDAAQPLQRCRAAGATCATHGPRGLRVRDMYRRHVRPLTVLAALGSHRPAPRRSDSAASGLDAAAASADGRI